MTKQLRTFIDCLSKAFFFMLNNFFNQFPFFNKFRISRFVFFNYRIADFIKKRLVYSQHFTVSGSSSQKSFKHISSALICRCNTVSYHKCCASDMVSNYTQRYIGIFIIFILYICNLTDLAHYILDCVNLEQIINSLNCTSKSFKPHTGINILGFHFSIVTVSVTVKLTEYQIPYFNDSITFACLFKAFKRTVAFSSVKMNFGTRTART